MDAAAHVVDGGYRVSGRWSFVSGCELATWMVLLCIVHEAGEPRISPLLAAFLCFVFMCGAVAAMSELDFGSPLNLLAELGNGE